jgi:uncharacterized protein YchJ
MSKNIGRNERCPCGSGFKFKYCCGVNAPSQRRSLLPRFQAEGVPPQVLQAILEHQRKEQERVRNYGHVRPPITLEHQSYRLVAVGSMLHFSKTWKTFHDFLGDYIKKVLGSDWGNAELKKPFDERHPILQWYHHVCLHQQGTIKEPGKVYDTIATGPDMAYLSLAYDLYTLEHHALLREKLVKRLKVKDQFQGARYETSVAAAFVRAGFDVELEDESDSAESHCEFTATHKQAGSKYSVEAKSRHRPGFLGQPGKPQPVEEIEADVYRLLQRALTKKAEHERVVFIDVNVPPHAGDIFEGWGDAVASQLKRLEDSQDPKKPWPPAFVFFTSHPYHYIDIEAPEPGRIALFTAINMPDFKKPDTDESAEQYAGQIAAKYPAIMQLYDSVMNHTQIPHEL